MSLPASQPPDAAPSRSEFSRGWKVLIAAILGVACGASPLPYNSFGFFLGPLHDEFGWSFRDISLGVTIYGVLGALLAPVYGWMADRYGVRIVALWSLFIFGLIFASLGAVPGSLPAYYAVWTLVGLVAIGSTPVTWSRAINLWFYRRRGLSLGLLLMGTSLAAIAVPQLTVRFISDFGWRWAYPLLALLPLLIALPMGVIFFREPRPDEMPRELLGAGGRGLLGLSLGEAVRGYRFWLLLVSILMVAFAYGGAHIHLPQMLKGHGFSTSDAALVMSCVGISILCGRIITGALLDYFWAPAITLPILSLPALACWLLAGDHVSMPIALFCAVLLGFASGAETDLVAYLAGRYYGMANYGKIYGVLYMPFGFASAVGPPVYGWVRDTYGSYSPMLHVAMGLFVVGALLLLALGRYPVFGDSHAAKPAAATGG